jgi:hypothetical protein
MLYLKNLKGYEYCLITTGGASIYNSMGQLKQNNVALDPSLMTGAQKVNGVSILVYNGDKYEIALESEDGLKRYKGGADVAQMIARMKANRDYIVCLNNKGKAEGVRYRQTIFVYQNNYDINAVVSQYGLTEVAA